LVLSLLAKDYIVIMGLMVAFIFALLLIIIGVKAFGLVDKKSLRKVKN
jgi:hypothetical protein